MMRIIISFLFKYGYPRLIVTVSAFVTAGLMVISSGAIIPYTKVSQPALNFFVQMFYLSGLTVVEDWHFIKFLLNFNRIT